MQNSKMRILGRIQDKEFSHFLIYSQIIVFWQLQLVPVFFLIFKLSFIENFLCQMPRFLSSNFLMYARVLTKSLENVLCDLQEKYYKNGKTHRQHFSEPLLDSLGQIFRVMWAWWLLCERILFYRNLGTTKMPEGAWPL